MTKAVKANAKAKSKRTNEKGAKASAKASTSAPKDARDTRTFRDKSKWAREKDFVQMVIWAPRALNVKANRIAEARGTTKAGMLREIIERELGKMKDTGAGADVKSTAKAKNVKSAKNAKSAKVVAKKKTHKVDMHAIEMKVASDFAPVAPVAPTVGGGETPIVT